MEAWIYSARARGFQEAREKERKSAFLRELVSWFWSVGHGFASGIRAFVRRRPFQNGEAVAEKKKKLSFIKDGHV